MSTKAEAEAKFRAVVASKGGEVVGDYAGTMTKVRLRCARGHEWEVTPNSVGNGSWCPTCSRKSLEDAEAKLRSVVEEKGGEVVTNYVNSQTKVGLRCAEGHEWLAPPNSILRGRWCPACAGKSSEAAETKFRTVVSEKGGEVVGDYVDTNTKVRLRCAEGHEWDVAPRSVTSMGSWCPTCACGIRSDKVRGKTRKKRSKAEAASAFREIVVAKGGEVLGTYVHSQTNVRLRCAEGHEWEAKPNNIVSSKGTWCPTCASVARSRRKARKGPSEARFRAIVASRGGEVLGTYVHSQTNVRLRCGHGHEWDARPANVVGHGTWCPTCAREAHGAKIRRKEASSMGTASPAAPSPAASDISLAALVLAMSRVGIDRIEEGDLPRAASRIAIWQKIAGPVVLDGRKIAIGTDDVERHVGIVIPGIEKLTADGFERRLGEIVAGG